MSRASAALYPLLAKTSENLLPRSMSSIDKHLIYKFEKYGELLEQEPGCFGNCNAPDILSRKEVDRLVRLGYARVDHVGGSTFVVFVRP